MSKMKFKLNRSGVRQLLKSAEMKGVLEDYAKGIQQTAGEGYKSDTHTGSTRVNAMVYADTYQAKSDNSKNNTLLKAVQ